MIIRDNFCKFCIKTYVDETVQVRGTTCGFNEKEEKSSLSLSSNTPSCLELCMNSFLLYVEMLNLCVLYISYQSQAN